MLLSRDFISAGKEYATATKFVPAPYFRRSFKAEFKGKAEVTICGLGFYELYINGKNITKGVLAPYISNPDQILFYDTYDITDLLETNAENVVGVLLGNGFQNNHGGLVWDFHKAEFRSAPKFAIAYEEDGELKFEADEKFLTCPSPILFDDYRMGTVYDARKEIYGWADKGFTPEGWTPAIRVVTPKGEPKPRLADPIVVTREIEPKEVIRNKNGFLYDFGENVTGICRLKITNAKKGQKIFLRHTEVAFLNNEPYYYNIICNARSVIMSMQGLWQGITYICRGGEEEYIPSFTYNGFRFVQVEGVTPEQAQKSLLTCLVINSDIKRRADFKCSSEMLNKLYAAALCSDLSNFVFFPTDCPHREKNGWTGDAAVSAEQFLLSFRSEVSLREWLKCIVRAQREDGALPGIVPTGGWGFKWGNGPSWDTVLFTLTYELYRLTGDKSVIEETAAAMEKYLRYIATKRAKNGTVAIGLGDWVEVDRHHGSRTPLAVTDTIQCFNMSKMAELLFGIIGQTERADFAREEKEKYYKDFRSCFVNSASKTVTPGTHTAQSMAIAYGIFEPEEVPAAGKNLADMIILNNRRLRSGMLGSRWAHEALHMAGYDDIAYDIVTNGDHSSPAYWINKGSNTLWETYSNVKTGENNRFALKDINKIFSLNHHFLGGGYMTWLYKSVLGIRQNEDLSNPAKVIISPAYVSSLSSAEGYIDFPAGKVEVKWTRLAGRIMLTVNAASSLDLEVRTAPEVEVIINRI